MYGDKFDAEPRRAIYLAVNDMYCGCGNPEEALELIHDLLKAAPYYENRERLKELLPTTGLEMLVLGALDNAQLVEHGGSIGGSWLTDRGKQVLAALDQVAAEEGYEAYEDTMRCAHGRTIEEDCPECSNGQ